MGAPIPQDVAAFAINGAPTDEKGIRSHLLYRTRYHHGRLKI
jgi:hypothetical protein